MSKRWRDYCGGTGRVPVVVREQQSGKVLIGRLTNRATARCPGCDACFWFNYLSGVVEDAARQIDREIIATHVEDVEPPLLNIPISFEYADVVGPYQLSLLEEVYEQFRLKR